MDENEQNNQFRNKSYKQLGSGQNPVDNLVMGALRDL